MPVLPVPMIIALLLGGFLVLRIVKGETHVTLLALIAACAMQGAIIALVQYYGISFLRPVQPVLATIIPPLAWFAFIRASSGEGPQRNQLWHAIGPALALLCLVVNPNLLDVLIPLSFTIYGVAMIIRLWGGEDSLPHSRLENGANALIAWRIVALALIASAGCDVLIAYGLAAGYSGVLLWVPSLVSSMSLLSLGALSLTHAIESRREQLAEEALPSQDDLERDQAIIAKLDDYMRAYKPHLDPDLTLARLARKLTVPAKQVSAAINRSKNENVSRYINRLRIEEACKLLAEGKSVTAAIFDSGFNTKSNFNREFLRVCGQNPRQWLAARAL
jgi:AraC-like DNA-binding protein